MHDINYLVLAYALLWLGFFAYLAIMMLRIRGIRTELAAMQELVRERSENDLDLETPAQ